MSDVDELLSAFEAGTLLRSNARTLNLVDLSRAVATASGVAGLELSPAAEEVAGTLAERDHIVLVLADGLGLEMLEGAPGADFLRTHLDRELRAVFPASTAVALTSLATGEWPARHGVTGWWTYLEEIAGPATILQYRRRADERSLEALGVEPSSAFPQPSLVGRIRREVHCLLPRAIAGSVYSRYWAGDRDSTGYDSLADGFGQAAAVVRGAQQPTFTYLYVPHVDRAAHEHGADSRETRAAMFAVSQLVEALARELGTAAWVALTADHGHLDAPDADRFRIQSDDGLSELLANIPSGDSRVLQFHVRDGEHERFEARFPRALRRRVLSADDLGGRGARATRTGRAERDDARANGRLHSDLARRPGARLCPREGLACGVRPHLAPCGAEPRRAARAAGARVARRDAAAG